MMNKLYVRSICTLFTLCLFSIVALAQGTRVVRVKSSSIERGQQGTVAVEIDAQGNENSAGFSLNFDPTLLTYVSAALGSGVPAGTTLIVNPNQVEVGHLGIAIALPFQGPNTTLPSGTRQLVVVTFSVPSTGNISGAPMSFGDSPVPRELVDANALVIPFTAQTFQAGTVALTRTAASVSAASFVSGGKLAPASIAAAFGAKLATAFEIASTVPLPTVLAGTRLMIKDSAGMTSQAPLFFVSANQINYQIPENTALGAAMITVTASDGTISTGSIEITPLAPGLFAANANGAGAAAAQVLRVRGSNLIYESAAQFNGTEFVPSPIDLGPQTDPAYLILYGAGFRFNGGLANVSVMIGDRTFPALYAGAAPGFIGLDQINVGPLPSDLTGAGVVNVKVTIATAGGPITSNTLTVRIK
jgi:uncharacterized protein (TIGR03437 family)